MSNIQILKTGLSYDKESVHLNTEKNLGVIELIIVIIIVIE